MIPYSFHTESGSGRSEGLKTVKRESVKHRPKDGVQPVVRRTVAVLAHRLVKEDKVPGEETDRALARMRKFAAAPERHTMLRRIATALGRRVEIRFPAVKTAKAPSVK